MKEDYDDAEKLALTAKILVANLREIDNFKNKSEEVEELLNEFFSRGVDNRIGDVLIDLDNSFLPFAKKLELELKLLNILLKFFPAILSKKEFDIFQVNLKLPERVLQGFEAEYARLYK